MQQQGQHDRQFLGLPKQNHFKSADKIWKIIHLKNQSFSIDMLIIKTQQHGQYSGHVLSKLLKSADKICEFVNITIIIETQH